MPTPLQTFFKKTRQTVHQLQNKVYRLKKQQEKEKEPKAIPLKLTSPERVLVDLSISSVAKATIVIILLYLLSRFLIDIRTIVVIFFVSLLLAAALDPTIDWLEKHKIPRWLGIIGIYILFFFILAFCISKLIPLVANQLLELAHQVGGLISNLLHQEIKFPFLERFKPFLEQFLESVDQQMIVEQVKEFLQKVGSQLQNVAGNTWQAIKVVFNGVFNAVLVLVLTFFMTVDEKAIDKFILSLFPSKYTNYIITRTEIVKKKVGHWLRGQFLLMLAVGILIYLGLSIIGLEYAMTLGLIAGITELIPYLGPIIAAVPAVLIGLNDSIWMSFWVIVVFIAVQQLENHILVPIIMKKAVGLNPIIVILVMLIGFEILGILGAIIAIPVATAISIFIKDYLKKEK